MKRKTPTRYQSAMLKAIANATKKTAPWPPSFDDVAKAGGYDSRGTVAYHLPALVAAGWAAQARRAGVLLTPAGLREAAK